MHTRRRCRCFIIARFGGRRKGQGPRGHRLSFFKLLVFILFYFIYLHCIFLFYLMVMITVTYLICCFYHHSDCLFLLFHFVTHSLMTTVTWLSTFTELVTGQNTFCMISYSGNIHTSSHTHTTMAKRGHMCIRHIQAQ